MQMTTDAHWMERCDDDASQERKELLSAPAGGGGVPTCVACGSQRRAGYQRHSAAIQDQLTGNMRFNVGQMFLPAIIITSLYNH